MYNSHKHKLRWIPETKSKLLQSEEHRYRGPIVPVGPIGPMAVHNPLNLIDPYNHVSIMPPCSKRFKYRSIQSTDWYRIAPVLFKWFSPKNEQMDLKLRNKFVIIEQIIIDIMPIFQNIQMKLKDIGSRTAVVLKGFLSGKFFILKYHYLMHNHYQCLQFDLGYLF